MERFSYTDYIKATVDFEKTVEENDAVLFYFSHDECNVCKVLKPKIAEMLSEQFPKMEMYYVDTKNQPEIAGQQSVFAVPTIVVYFGGTEYFRRSRNIGIGELEELLKRPYEMMFE